MQIFRLNTPEFFAPEEITEFEDYLEKFPETYYVIERDGEIRGGFACEYRQTDKSGRINWIFIAPESKESGLGSEAVNFCFENFKSNKQIERLVIRTSQFAWKFFSKFGYRLIERIENYWAKGIDLYLMEMGINDFDAIQTWNKVSQQYSDKFNQLEIYNKTYDAFLDLLPNAAEILEVACGPGTITGFLQKNRPDIKIDATDLSHEMIKLAAIAAPEASFRVLDCRDLQQIEKRYNAIICGFCLPYLNVTEVERFISDCKQLLKKDGILYLSFIEGKQEDSKAQKSSDGKYELFVHYYPTEIIAGILSKYNFYLQRTFAVKYPNTNDVHSILIAVSA